MFKDGELVGLQFAMKVANTKYDVVDRRMPWRLSSR